MNNFKGDPTASSMVTYDTIGNVEGENELIERLETLGQIGFEESEEMRDLFRHMSTAVDEYSQMVEGEDVYGDKVSIAKRYADTLALYTKLAGSRSLYFTPYSEGHFVNMLPADPITMNYCKSIIIGKSHEERFQQLVKVSLNHLTCVGIMDRLVADLYNVLDAEELSFETLYEHRGMISSLNTYIRHQRESVVEYKDILAEAMEGNENSMERLKAMNEKARRALGIHDKNVATIWNDRKFIKFVEDLLLVNPFIQEPLTSDLLAETKIDFLFERPGVRTEGKTNRWALRLMAKVMDKFDFVYSGPPRGRGSGLGNSLSLYISNLFTEKQIADRLTRKRRSRK